MKLERLISFFAASPSAKLLRSTHAPYVIYFLNQHFKEGGNLASQQATLLQRLTQFLDDLHETEPDVLREAPETYLTNWSTGDTRWLRRYIDAHGELTYQLTPHTEDVLKFLSQVLDQKFGFVGTESRLSRIIETLSDIVVRGSSDPNRRLEYLYAERTRIAHEIQTIEAGGEVTTHSPTAIRERFADAVSDLISLQGDFRAVEESFKNITRDVQRQQAEATDPRGSILGYALDAEDRLKQEDQGASFQAFVRLILSQHRQEQLERLIAQLDQIVHLAEHVDGKKRLQGMIGSLSAEAEKVLSTTRRLSSSLRRLLDSRASASRQRLATVLREIQVLAARQAECPSPTGVEVDVELDLLNVAQRTFWEAPIQFQAVPLSLQAPSDDERLLAFRELAEMRRLDWERMRSNIDASLRQQGQITLPDLLRLHPPHSGSLEVVGYMQIAHDDGHEVDHRIVDVITIDAAENDGTPQQFQIPRVVFSDHRTRLAGVTARNGKDTA